jgi:hypothetical protein
MRHGNARRSYMTLADLDEVVLAFGFAPQTLRVCEFERE